LAEEIKRQLKARKRQRARKAKLAAAAGGAAFVLFWVVPFLRDTAVFATGPAQRQTVELSDGSKADLDALTHLRADFRYGRRVLQLTQGEAFFSVAKDAAHPFLVATPHGTVRVTGTHFDVRLGANQEPEVTLIEGSVAFQGVTPDPVPLAPGEQLSMASGTPKVRTLSRAELDSAVAWRNGRLVLEGLTLDQAVQRFAAYHGRSITVDPAVGPVHMGGVCPLADLDTFLSGLEEAHALKVTKNADGSIAIGPR
jgi:transmembrane sensor